MTNPRPRHPGLVRDRHRRRRRCREVLRQPVRLVLRSGRTRRDRRHGLPQHHGIRRRRPDGRRLRHRRPGSRPRRLLHPGCRRRRDLRRRPAARWIGCQQAPRPRSRAHRPSPTCVTRQATCSVCSPRRRPDDEQSPAEHARELYDELTDDLLYDPAIGRATMMGYPCVRLAGQVPGVVRRQGRRPGGQAPPRAGHRGRRHRRRRPFRASGEGVPGVDRDHHGGSGPLARVAR